MKISTKVQCGIVAIVDISMYSESGEAVTVFSIAKRRGLSGKYLEQVLTALKHRKLIKGIKGAKGGYVLSKPMEKITLKEIIDAMDPSVLGNDIAEINSENEVLTNVIDNLLWSRIEGDAEKIASSLTLDRLVGRYALESGHGGEPMYYI